MKKCRTLLKGSVISLFIVFCICLFPLQGESPAEEPLIPSIEDLTQGRVKVGDVIDKNNVDLVKEYLSAGAYEDIMRGMVMVIGEHLSPEKLVPKFFWEATERNKGKAVLKNDYGTVVLNDGSPWPGGIPFPDAQTGLEAMANRLYGSACDDFHYDNQWGYYINKDGGVDKTVQMAVCWAWTVHRFKCPPLGVYPGLGDELYRRWQIFYTPLHMKGLGQVATRYYDVGEKVDSGFAYLPSFKRVIRMSATTYQDNIGGGDMCYCDPEGVNDPYLYWKFKLLEKNKLLLTSATKIDPFTTLSTPEGHPDPEKTKFDVGKKYIRLRWALTPGTIVEATPTIKHIYAKKIMHQLIYPYWTAVQQMGEMEMYDRAGQLWKTYHTWRGGVYEDEEGNTWGNWYGMDVHDLQTGHATRYWCKRTTYNSGVDPKSINLKKLLELGK